MVLRRICIGLILALIMALTLTLIVILAGGSFSGAPKALRNDLWRVVHYGCVPNQRVFGLPAPCSKVDLAGGFAVVPSVEHNDQLLVVPTLRVSGVEDRRLLDPQTPNYFADAWAERPGLVTAGRAVPDDWIGLVVNSAYARTQDQLHIHIDCLQGWTYAALHNSQIGRYWSIIEPFPGQYYRARYVDAADFASVSPFRVAAMSVGVSPATMARQTIVVVRANGGMPGFYILTQAFNQKAHADGFGEDLLDHRCHGVRTAVHGPILSSR